MLALTLTTYITALAQVKITAGPELGFQLANMRAHKAGQRSSGEFKPGLRVGGIVDINTSYRLSIQTGILYCRKGYEIIFDSRIPTKSGENTRLISKRLKTHYVEFPLTVQYKIAENYSGYFFGGGGGYAAIAAGGDVTNEVAIIPGNATNPDDVTTRSIDRNLEIGNDAWDDVQSADVGLSFNTGFMWYNGLYIRAFSDIGITNIAPQGNDNNKLKNLSFGIAVGYLIGK